MNYRYSIMNYMESETISVFYGVIVQEVEEEDTGRCKFIPRVDAEFLSTKIPDSGDQLGALTLADRLRGVDAEFNEELSRDVSIGPFEQADGTWVERRVALPGSPGILEILRDIQPRLYDDDPNSPPLYPRFSFSDWSVITLDKPLEEALEAVFAIEFEKVREEERKHGIING